MTLKFLTGLHDLFGLHDFTDSSSSSTTTIATNNSFDRIESTPATSSAAAVAAAATTISMCNDENSQDSVVSDLTSDGDNKAVVEAVEVEQQADDVIEKEIIRRCTHDRKVHFLESIVSQFHDAPISFSKQRAYDPDMILNAYINSCKRLRIAPIPEIQEQIKCFHQVFGIRQECLSLKAHRLSSQCIESLEEILRYVQFDMLDFEYTFLDDDCAVCVGEMIEFYDSAVKLNLSFNKQINLRGWQAIFKAVKNAASLHSLNLRYTSLSDRAVSIMGRTLRFDPPLTILHLENVSLSGRNLIVLGSALKCNTALKELYLGENSLQPTDGAQLYQMIIVNSSLQLLDLRNNQLQDGGLRHICDALRHRDTIKRSGLTALVLWNNRLTSESMGALGYALVENNKLETLNIGNNNLSVDGITALKSALQKNCSIQRLGLQATNLDCQGAIVLAECLADNKVMMRLDLRDNPQIASAGLLALHSAMKMNTYLTLLNLDTSIANSNSSKVKEYREQFKEYYDEIKFFCERNRQLALKNLCVHATPNKENVIFALDDETNAPTPSELSSECMNEDQTHSEFCAELSTTEETVEKNTSPSLVLNRSASLTCAETIHDIPQRVAEMSHSLSLIQESVAIDVQNVSEKSSLAAIVPHVPGELCKSYSLPSINTPPSSSTETPSVAKRRITRRFTVSTSSLNDNPREMAASRFKVERVFPLSKNALKSTSDLSKEKSKKNTPDLKSENHRTSGEEEPPPPTLQVIYQKDDSIGKAAGIENKMECIIPPIREQPDRTTFSVDEDAVQSVVNDMINYVCYELNEGIVRGSEVQVSGQCLSRSARQHSSAHGMHENESLSGCVDDETDQEVIRQLMRRLIRDVLVNEKTNSRRLTSRAQLLTRVRTGPGGCV